MKTPSSKFLYYAALGFLPPFIDNLQMITPETQATMRWNNWLVLVLSPIYSTLLTLKALRSPTESKQ